MTNKTQFKPTSVALSSMALDTAGIRVSPIAPPIAYSDGEGAENYIIETLEKSDDCSVLSVDLRRRIRDWPSEYHLTSQRANLLRHIPFKKGDQILEIGAGCGAITRYLAECGCEVDAIEGTYRRAVAAQTRCKDLPNAKIHCGNFDNIDLDKHYDYVLVIGVLEYASKFIASDQPFHAFIKRAESALAEDGTLIIAIENRLGLKYFSGCTEDHVGRHFFGIENRYTKETAATFGREELADLLNDCGFQETRFDYPFPDYKIPACVITERGSNQREFLAAELIRHYGARDYSGRKVNTIDDVLAWPAIWRNGLLPKLSNSFLVRARRQSPTHADELLAVVYSTDRAPHLAIKTEFLQLEDSISVEKTKLKPNPAPLATTYISEPQSSRYKPEKTLHSVLLETISKGDKKRTEFHLRQWLDFYTQTAADSLTVIGNGRYCNGSHFDCTPRNLLVNSDNSLSMIDDEWRTHALIPFNTAVIRYFRLQLNFKRVTKLLGLPESLIGLVNHFLPAGYTPVQPCDLNFETLFFTHFLFREIHPFISHHSAEDWVRLALSEGQRAYDKNDVESAKSLLTACGLLADNPHLLNDAALLFIMDRDRETAIQLIQKIQALAPQHPEAMMMATQLLAAAEEI
jgi:2-polyprenyl-3-methyl-5-hydroxy-6-metoxy-1,4-benzoquinol methylase